MRPLTQALCIAGALAFGAIGGTALSDGSSSTALGASDKCTASSLTGSYGVRFDGHSGELGRFASVSLWKFNGNGKMTASETYNSDNTGPQERDIKGAYSVKRDCTFELRFGSDLVAQHDAHGVCVLQSGGKEFVCIDNEAGWVTTGTGKKV